MNRFLDEVGDRELDPDCIAYYTESLDGLAVGSQAVHISSVRSFLRVCQSQGLIEKSPVEFLVRPKVGITSYGRYLDLEELRALVQAATELSPAHRAVVLLLWSTGLRVSEAANARWLDVFADPAGRVGLRVVGKGQKERVVKLPRETLSSLGTIREGEHPGSEGLDASDKSPLIPYLGQAASSWTVWRYVSESVKKAKLTKPASPHWLRHSFGTWSAYGGANAFTIQWAMGHSKLETSARYVHQAKGLEDTASDYLPSVT